MLIVLFYLIMIPIYLVFPLGAKALVFIINLFVPDPLPYIDEIFMALSIMVHAKG